MEVGRVQPVANHLNKTNDFSSFSDPSFTQKENKAVEKQEKEVHLSENEVKKAIDGLNRMFDASQTHLKFMFHDKAGEFYVQVVDDQRNEVIREIPSKKILDIVANIKQSIGIVFDEKI